MALPKQNSRKKRKAKEFIQRTSGNIKYYRVKRRLSQEKLEEETGLYIPRYESGRHDMTLTTLYILSEYLRVRPFNLLK